METVDTERDHAAANEHEHGHERGHGHEGHDHEKPMSPEEVVSSLLLLGQVALNAGDYESAVDAYASVLQLKQNEAALYNLGSLRARGFGIRQDFVEAARLFHQAELLGNEKAGRLCGKCMFDYVNDGLDDKTPADLYAAMAVFVSRVYPEATDQRLEANHGLLAIAGTHLSKGAYAEGAKVLRAAAEFGGDDQARGYLADLADAGI